ncbi:MAG: YihY/virulence factor BrkB family protein [Bacteroidetes bacterium]|nr:YihY/virulence factor BrkB family protein [Bacteroidota bacterium]
MKFKQLEIINKIIGGSKRIILPGFDGMPLYDVTLFFFRGMMKGSITTRASSMSFSFFLALFPAIIFFFTLIPYLPIHNFQDILLDLMKGILPGNAYEASKETLIDIVQRQRGGLLSIGFVLALFFATNGINSIIDAFNSTYHTMETRSWYYQRLVSIILVLISVLLITIGILVITLSSFGIDFLVKEGIIRSMLAIYLVMAGKWVVILAIFFFTISFIYFLAPSKKERFRFISAGSTMATILSILTSLGFNFYVNNFAKYNALYGSIGTLIIILMWIYFNAIILLVGFELNASISAAKKQKQIIP